MKFSSSFKDVLPADIKCVPAPTDSRLDDNILDKFRGSLVGLATGDALGASVEFRPHSFLAMHPVHDMQSGGTWGLAKGQWTDDTSMALCLASSLITHKSFNPYDQMVLYKWWYQDGFLSSTGQCFDIGNATREALEEFCRRQNKIKKHLHHCAVDNIDHVEWNTIRNVPGFNVNCGEPNAAGNGALMRLAAVPLFFYRIPHIAIELSGQSARLTHGDQRAIDACRYYGALIVAAVKGEPKESLLDDDFYEKHLQWFGPNELHQEVLYVAHGSYKKPGGYKEGIRGKTYIIQTLEAALWAFWNNRDSFEKGILDAVNLGDDADTVAAIYGQLAGAHYGLKSIPQHWQKQLYAQELIVCISDWIYFVGGQSASIEQQSQIASNPTPIVTQLHQTNDSSSNKGNSASSSTVEVLVKLSTPVLEKSKASSASRRAANLEEDMQDKKRDRRSRSTGTPKNKNHNFRKNAIAPMPDNSNLVHPMESQKLPIKRGTNVDRNSAMVHISRPYEMMGTRELYIQESEV